MKDLKPKTTLNNQSRQVVGILGLGEVGKAIKKACQKYYLVLGKDVDKDDLGRKKVDILHVCIPFFNSKQFIKIVISQIKLNSPQLVIIDSTVAPGTARKIQKETYVKTVHAPIMGIHPNLYDYLFVFPKFIGAVDEKGKKLAANHFKRLGLKVIFFKKAEETELAKLMSTTYYGLAIIFSKWLKIYCDKNKLNFENVYSKFNQAYNKGYKKSLPNVIRPILKPKPGRIGGHCVVPNAEIIKKNIGDPFGKLIVNFDKFFLQEEGK